MSDAGIILEKIADVNLIKLKSNDAVGTGIVSDSDKSENIFNYGNTTLTNFLSHTSNTDILANIIDPLCTFDVQFDFFPQTFLINVVNTILRSANADDKNMVTKEKLILDLSFYIQSMSIPQMQMPEAGKVPTLFGDFPVNNLYVKPDNNTFTMSILNTKMSIHDYIFYPWMREVTMPYWVYDDRPYTTANVTVKFDKHSNTRYVFCGCRPSSIASRQPTQEPNGEPTRDVTMIFDYMFITYASNNGMEEYYNTAFTKYATSSFSNSEIIQDRIL